MWTHSSKKLQFDLNVFFQTICTTLRILDEWMNVFLHKIHTGNIFSQKAWYYNILPLQMVYEIFLQFTHAHEHSEH